MSSLKDRRRYLRLKAYKLDESTAIKPTKTQAKEKDSNSISFKIKRTKQL
jgi:hypothetical protein